MGDGQGVVAWRQKKNWYIPSPSVLAAWIVPLAWSRSSTTAPGTTALLGSVTTPVNPPEVVVWARESWIAERTRQTINKSWMGSFHLVEGPTRSESRLSTGVTTCERSRNTTLFACYRPQLIVGSVKLVISSSKVFKRSRLFFVEVLDQEVHGRRTTTSSLGRHQRNNRIAASTGGLFR